MRRPEGAHAHLGRDLDLGLGAALLDALVSLVDARVAAALSQREAAPYSTTNLPPGVDRRAFHARCRDLSASGDARVWKLTPTSRRWFARHEVFAAPTSTPTALPANDPTAAPVVWSVEAALAGRTRATR
jgi:hypothetical protein